MDKRLLETILADQAEELELKKKLRFCRRGEEDRIDLSSPQAQVVIGVRRSGKSTLCYNALIFSEKPAENHRRKTLSHRCSSYE